MPEEKEEGETMNALKALDSPPTQPRASETQTYTNFPTIVVAGHTLMLRRSWPDDLSHPTRNQASHLIHQFGTEGEVLELSDRSGQTLAAQWIRVHRNDPLPESGSSAWPGSLSSLRTALRYSRLGWLEIGPLHVDASGQSKGAMKPLVTALMWLGLQRLLERNGLGFALGLACVPPSDADAPVTDMVPALLEKYGLHPEFGYQPRKFPSRHSPQSARTDSEEPRVPAELREALRRGAKLCGEPHCDAEGNAWFFWAYSAI
jgi:hypothetical protein